MRKGQTRRYGPSTRKGQFKKTKTRAYKASGWAKRKQKKVDALEGRIKRQNATIRKMRGGNPMPHGPLSSELAAYSYVAAGGAMSGWARGQMLKLQASGYYPTFIPPQVRPEWLVTAALIAIPSLGYVKGRNAARLALISSGMAAAQASDFVAQRA